MADEAGLSRKVQIGAERKFIFPVGNNGTAVQE